MITKETVLQEAKDTFGEWLEMSHDPHGLLADILSQKIVLLTNQIAYLERRLQHVSSGIC